MRFERTILLFTLFSFVVILATGVLMFTDNIPTSFAATSTEDAIAMRRAQLEKDLAHLEALIEQQQVLLESKQGERVTLERDLAILDAEIEKSRLAIEAQTKAIANLEVDIFDKEANVLVLEDKISREKESLASLVRRTDELDSNTMVEVIFSQKSLSEFFEELDDFQEVKVALDVSFRELESLRDKNLEEVEILGTKKEEEEELQMLHKLQSERLRQQETEKVRILEVTEGEEKKYQDLISSNQRSAAQIRSELFELRGTSAINLGQAIEFATFAGNKTGVRPAFILGVLKQETRLGEFLGNGSWQVDMHPTRDAPLYKVICDTLGLDPNSMPVSAGGATYYGGAMGPSQFIPSTWACYGGYINTRTGSCSYTSSITNFYSGPWKYDANADRLRVVRGKQSPSNPWDNQDAFLATALYMKDLGADAGTLYAERKAALMYYAGSNWSSPTHSFYGDGVMSHAEYYQNQIDALKELSD